MTAIAIGTTVQFVTTAPSPALRTGIVVAHDPDPDYVIVGVTTTRRLGHLSNEHATPRRFGVKSSDLTEV